MSKRSERGPLKLARGRLWTVYIVSIGVWITGALWLIYHYFMRTQGRFGFSISPWEPWWLKLHGAFSFASIFVFGLLWSIHIVRGWNVNWRRWSGGWLVGFTAILVLTGYGLYYIDGKDWRAWTSIAHWVLGLAALAVFLIHWLSKSLPKRST